MNRPTYLACIAAMLGLAAFSGVALARWRNHANLAGEKNPPAPVVQPALVSRQPEIPRPSASGQGGRDPQEDLLEDAGVYFRTPQPSFSIANEKGQIMDQGLEEAGVALGKKEEIQAALDVARASILASMKKRVQPDERNSDTANGIRAYLIPAEMGLRERILGKLEADLTGICGADKGALLTRALHPGGRFGYYGRQSMMVRIITRPDGSEKVAEYKTFDPVSGRETRSGTMNEETFRKRFGDLIEW